MNNTIKIKGSALASRSSAAKIREDLLVNLFVQERVTVDLKEAISVSDSFADELFGILALRLGLDEFKKRVYVVTSSEEVLRAIAESIYQRVGMGVAA